MPASSSLRRIVRSVARKEPEAKIRSLPNPSDADVLGEFRFFAMLGTWMEEDVVEANVRNAFAQGAERVFLVDNGSTDATVDRARDAGATLAESFITRSYVERVRILLMNAVVARESLASGADHVWWLWLDADEFPEGPSGMTIAAYLSTLDRRFRVVGSDYYNHFPTGTPSYIEGFHPLDFQPMCERFDWERTQFCPQGHWKHPLQRFDATGSFLMSSGGFHTVSITNEPPEEPEVGIITHHIQYREEGFTRARLERLAGTSRRNAFNDSIGNTGIRKRFESLDAVYAQRWDQVENQRKRGSGFGVHPEPWATPIRRWYEPTTLDAARAHWLAEHQVQARAR
jgi:hypothetical protein